MPLQSALAHRFVHWFTPSALFLFAFLLTVATANDYGVTWDEPPYFHATGLHGKWISEFSAKLLRGDLRTNFADETIKAAWHWNPYNVPHPPFSRIISAGTKSLSAQYLDTFSAYRTGPALFFAMLVTVMYLWLREICGPVPGLFSAMALILTPNLFAYAHIAVTDLPLAAMWFVTVYCFWKGLDDWRWSLTLGIVWGLALSTKFPAVLIPVPLIIWAHIFSRDRYANNIAALFFVAPVVMVATQPYLWHQTSLRLLEFVYEGISRGYRPDANFGVFFLNRIMLSQQLPWFYPFYLVGVTTPEPILLLALLGLFSFLFYRQQRAAVTLFALTLLFILGLGLLPGAVLHDGVRQMLSALPFLAALSGLGIAVLTNTLISLPRHIKAFARIAKIEYKITVVLFICMGVIPAIDLYLVHPYQLSYYNRFVGGIRGAYERGFEITYFMEAITPAFIKRLNEILPRDARVNASFANFMFEFYQKEGIVRRDIRFSESGAADFYIVLNRRSVLSAKDRQILQSSATVIDAVTVAGVPLVALYDLKKTH